MKKALVYAILFFSIFSALDSHAEEAKQIVLDGIVASIDGKPITLSDVSKRVNRPLTLQDCATDPITRAAVDSMIKERLIQAESDSKRISASKEDVDSYINEVAERNTLTRPQFEVALKEQGKDIETYKEEIKNEILKARLTSSYLQANSGISDEEVDNYLAKHAAREKKNGSRITLRQIILLKEKHSPEQAKKTLSKIISLIDDGDDFDDLATEYSEGSEANEDGLLGTMSVNELSSEVFNAVLSLQEDQVSEITETAAGFHLFFVDKKEEQEESEEQLTYTEEERSSARQILEQSKLSNKTEQYFAEELYKLHSVDRKI